MKVVKSEQIQSSKTTENRVVDYQGVPLGTGKVWNKTRPMKKPKSKISKFDDGGEKMIKVSPHMAPGVPNDKNIKRGWYDPDANPTKSRGGSGDLDGGAYPAGAQTTYD